MPAGNAISGRAEAEFACEFERKSKARRLGDAVENAACEYFFIRGLTDGISILHKRQFAHYPGVAI
jgi:hypothetical protein